MYVQRCWRDNWIKGFNGAGVDLRIALTREPGHFLTALTAAAPQSRQSLTRSVSVAEMFRTSECHFSQSLPDLLIWHSLVAATHSKEQQEKKMLD